VFADKLLYCRHSLFHLFFLPLGFSDPAGQTNMLGTKNYKEKRRKVLLNRKKRTRNRRALSPSRAFPSQRARAQSTKILPTPPHPLPISSSILVDSRV